MNVINKIRIKQIKRHIYFNNTFPNNKEINNIFHKNIIELMHTALELNDKEVLILMQNSNFNTRKTTSYLKDKVFLTTEMENALLENNDITYTAFHNHPNNSNISMDDINMLLRYDKLHIIVIVTNDCKHISLVLKARKLSNEDKETIKNLYILDINRFSTVIEKYGLYYIHRQN